MSFGSVRIDDQWEDSVFRIPYSVESTEYRVQSTEYRVQSTEYIEYRVTQNTESRLGRCFPPSLFICR